MKKRTLPKVDGFSVVFVYTAFSLLFAFCLPFRLIGGDLSADRRSPVGSLSVIVNLLSVACDEMGEKVSPS